MTIDLVGIRARRAAVPRPPWRWSGYKHGTVDLVTAHSGQKIIVSTQRGDSCPLWWELDEPERMCKTCRTWYELREAVEHPDECTDRRPVLSRPTASNTRTCVERFDLDLAGVGACDACARYINAREEWDDERGPRCEKPENWGTLWIGDPEHGFMEPINKYATKERDYRDDVNPVVDHPVAEFLRMAAADVDALLAEVDRLTAELAETREACDAACRSVGQRAVEGVQHGDERARAAFNGPRITLADARREARQ